MKKILITEDDPFIADLYQTKFQVEGFDVALAGTGKAAIHQLTTNQPDVVLLDLMLPEVNGVEVLKFIRSSQVLRDLPVVVLSSSVAGDLVRAAHKAGAYKFLNKATSTPRHVVEEVRNALVAHDPKPESDDNSEEGLREAFRRRVPQLVTDLRALLQPLVKSDPVSREPAMVALCRSARVLASHAALAGFSGLAQMAGSLEVMLNELAASPRKVTTSTLHTVTQVVDFIPSLLVQDHAQSAPPAPLIMVLDDEVISRETLCLALERASLRGLACEDPLLALKVAEENRFDLIFLDVDMPVMNGFEVYQKLRASALNGSTPIVFVTALSDFETRARVEAIGATDFIAKPVVLVELAVKAVLHLLRGRVARAGIHDSRT